MKKDTSENEKEGVVLKAPASQTTTSSADPLAFAGFINSKAQFPSWGQSIKTSVELIKTKSALSLVWLIMMGVFFIFTATGVGGYLGGLGSIAFYIFVSWLTGTTASYVMHSKNTVTSQSSSHFEKLRDLRKLPKSSYKLGPYVRVVGGLSAIWFAGAMILIFGIRFLPFDMLNTTVLSAVYLLSIPWNIGFGSFCMWISMISGPLIALHSQGALESLRLGIKALAVHPKHIIPLAFGWVIFSILCSSGVIRSEWGLLSFPLAIVLPPVGLLLTVHTVGYYKTLYLQPQSWIKEKLKESRAKL